MCERLFHRLHLFDDCFVAPRDILQVCECGISSLQNFSSEFVVQICLSQLVSDRFVDIIEITRHSLLPFAHELIDLPAALLLHASKNVPLKGNINARIRIQLLRSAS